MSSSHPGGGSNSAPINSAPFSNVNPFDSTSEHASSSRTTESSAEQRSHEEEEEPLAESQGNDKAVKSPPRAIRWASHKSNGKDASRDDSTTIDKVETAHDHSIGDLNTTPSVVDKIKTAAAEKFHLHSIHATGPGKIFNPTTVRAHIRWKESHRGDSTSNEGTKPDLSLLWRSRDNRKGRNSMVVPHKTVSPTEKLSRNISWYSPDVASKLKEIGKHIATMFTTFPYWDMAFWSGWSYTIGSALFVIDGAFAWSIAAFPDSEFAGEDQWGVPLCFFIGAIFYQIGAVMAYLEAVNDGSFHGSAMRKLLEGHKEDQKKMLDEKIHGFFGHLVPHPHKHQDEEKELSIQTSIDPEAGWRTKDTRQRPGSIYLPGKAPAPRRGGVDMGEVEEGETTTYLTWRWWPSWYMLRTHHVYEIGYLACAIQLFGVTLYGVTAIVVLPGILDSLNEWQTNAAYWIPQMVAAACFLIASIMFTLETQEKWWKPELKTLGWWIGFWSTVGSVGFELCAAFGPPAWTKDWADYQSELSSMWGSAAYLIGSLLQWYEAVNKNPVSEILNEKGEMKSWMVHPL